jgi:hypothetical protein
MVEKGDDLLEYSYTYLSPGREKKGGEKGAAGLEAGVVPRRLRQATQTQTCSAVCLCAALDWSLDSQANDLPIPIRGGRQCQVLVLLLFDLAKHVF